MTVSMPDDVYRNLIDRMKENGEDPEERGAKIKYIVDAVRFKNGLVKAGKWVPAEAVDFKTCKIGK